MFDTLKRWWQKHTENRRLIEQYKRNHPALATPYYCPFDGNQVAWKFYIVPPTKFDTTTGKPINWNKRVRVNADVDLNDGCLFTCVHYYDEELKQIISFDDTRL